MRKMVLMAFFVGAPIFFFATGCSHERKAHRLIRNHIKENLSGDYRGVKFSKIDSSFTKVADDSMYVYYLQAHTALVDLYNNKDERLTSMIMQDIIGSDRARRNFDRLTAWQKEGLLYSLTLEYKSKILPDVNDYWAKSDSISGAFNPQFNGWVIAHDFTLKNKGENASLHYYVFRLDEKMSKVVSSFNADEWRDKSISERQSARTLID